MSEFLLSTNDYSEFNTDDELAWSRTENITQTSHGDYRSIEYSPLDIAIDTPPLVVTYGLGRRIGSRKSIIPDLKKQLPSTRVLEVEPVNQLRDSRISTLGQVEAIGKLGVDEHNELGISLGGYESAARAAYMGSRVLNLTTIAAIGVGRPVIMGMMRSESDSEVSDMKSRILDTSYVVGETALWLMGCVRQPRRTLTQIGIIFDDSTKLDNIIDNLHDETRLTMVAGALDSAAPPEPTESLVKLRRQRVGDDRANFVMVRGIAHGLTGEGKTISSVVAATNRHEYLEPVINIVR